VTVLHHCPAKDSLAVGIAGSAYSLPSAPTSNAASAVQKDQERQELAACLKQVANSGFINRSLKVLNFDIVSPDGKEIILSSPADKTSAIVLSRLGQKVIDVDASGRASAQPLNPYWRGPWHQRATKLSSRRRSFLM
jgi:hypothetical protein